MADPPGPALPARPRVPPGGSSGPALPARGPGSRRRGPLARWWWARSLRARLTLLASVVLAVGLAAGGALLVGTLASSLQTALDETAVQRGRDVAALVDSGRLADPVPVGGPTSVVQVVDADRRIRAASPGADRLVPLLDAGELRRARDGERLYVDGDRAGVEGPLLVVGVPAGPEDDPQTVVVAVGVASTVQSLRVVRAAVLLGFPLLLGLLAVLSWLVVGWTLRPVEALRRGAEEITGTGSGSRRLPVADAEDEVHRLAVTLNGMLGRLDAARQRQRDFVADAAHELRSPLASMRTQLEVAARHGRPEDWPATTEDLLVDVDRLSRLVDDLLLLARLDDAGASPGPRDRARDPVELGGLVADVVQRYAAARVPVRAAEAGTAGEAWTEGDPDHLRRVVANLLDNAVRHATSAVRVEVTPGPGVHQVTVADDGPGIPATDRERVFGRFTRLDEARSSDDGGSGLGLAIARELVGRHGGSVRLDDAVPGLRAEVRLPAVPAPRRVVTEQAVPAG